MKISKLFFLVFIVVSCTNPYFSEKSVFICLTDNEGVNYGSVMLPVIEGNKWTYEYQYNADYLNSLNEKKKAELPKKYVLEVGKETYLLGETEEGLVKIKANKLVQNGDTSEFLYFIKCDLGASIVEVDDQENLVIKGSLLLRDNPNGEVHYWNGFRRAKYEWLGEIKEDSPLGSVNLYPLRELLYNENVINPRDKKITPKMLFLESSTSWYSPGIGLVKKEIYKNKKFVGFLVLKDYKVEKSSSPIAP